MNFLISGYGLYTTICKREVENQQRGRQIEDRT